jgi:hypothetical protein
MQVALLCLVLLFLLIALGFVWQGHRTRGFWISTRGAEPVQPSEWGGTVLAHAVTWKSFLRLSIDRPHYFEFYAVCYWIAVLMIPTLAWLNECALMRSAGITLANVSIHRSGSLGTLWRAYQFTDPMAATTEDQSMPLGGWERPREGCFLQPQKSVVQQTELRSVLHRLRRAEMVDCVA